MKRIASTDAAFQHMHAQKFASSITSSLRNYHGLSRKDVESDDIQQAIADAYARHSDNDDEHGSYFQQLRDIARDVAGTKCRKFRRYSDRIIINLAEDFDLDASDKIDDIYAIWTDGQRTSASEAMVLLVEAAMAEDEIPADDDLLRRVSEGRGNRFYGFYNGIEEVLAERYEYQCGEDENAPTREEDLALEIWSSFDIEGSKFYYAIGQILKQWGGEEQFRQWRRSQEAWKRTRDNKSAAHLTQTEADEPLMDDDSSLVARLLRTRANAS
jgi:hypothetical protein